MVLISATQVLLKLGYNKPTNRRWALQAITLLYNNFKIDHALLITEKIFQSI